MEQLETKKGELEEEVSILSAEKQKYDLLVICILIRSNNNIPGNVL